MTRADTLLDREPLRYYPFETGRYDVSAGLTRLGEQRVHGRIESHVFAFDATYERFLTAKIEARPKLHFFYQQAALSPMLRRAVLAAMLPRLAEDAREFVSWNGETLRNDLLGWSATLNLDEGSIGALTRFPARFSASVANVEPLDALDFLALNVSEDFSIVARSNDTGEDWLAALHVCAPQHWDPREKIGRSFGPVHAPVGGSAALIATAPRLVHALTHKGPFARFAWGLATSDRLEHHPATRDHEDRSERPFDPESTFVRVERQTLTPFPDERGAFFTIRPYLYALREVAADADRRARLAAALRSMTAEHLAYKGMTSWRDEVAAWLET
ncbi:heme-dependent oxidative N-demethylase subunit alpha family protein [Deinococcus yavapaiensis]|uniref:Uncharacterized protein DUF3445 n=1 Tax=Deinococcus yavapaiensis KR-236 TaxID=694435 RepID=A0A318SA05_9DEIO|nr:heme-dependent oxidative N-demethylase subunit alpha family protein [Deinococcus yavapaiensis]PYE56250.1 uncharacterized protein DUF3445 [Deinococcus yavapaiensis KR-236]